MWSFDELQHEKAELKNHPDSVRTNKAVVGVVGLRGDGGRFRRAVDAVKKQPETSRDSAGAGWLPRRDVAPAREGMQFHVLSFEGPDAYSRAGGITTRVEGLTHALAAEGSETHLWFIGDPDAPGNELRGSVNLHRWAQWVSRYHPGGVYDGELGKSAELARSLPPHLVQDFLTPHISEGGQTVVLAEEWQTVDAVLHLDYLLRAAKLRDRVSILWNANNTFGFDRIHWERLAAAAIITTVSRYMKHQMWGLGVNPLVIPNGLSGDAFIPPDQAALLEIQRRFRGRTLLAKMARWDPDKRWLAALEIVAAMKQRQWRPLLIHNDGADASRRNNALME